MRIIAGSFGGRILRASRTGNLRPAMAKTREALFSMLESRGIDWKQCKILDLFAGCGSLGFECLSRGASLAVFVDNAKAQIECLQENANKLNIREHAIIQNQDALRFLRQKPYNRFDLVFLDPPYRRNLTQKALALLSDNDWLSPDGLVIAEVEKSLQLPVFSGLELIDSRFFGQTSLHMWEVK